MTARIVVPNPYVLAQSAVAVTAPADTNENILATVTVPAGAMGPNGQIFIWSSWQANNDASAKNQRIRFGGIAGTIYCQPTITSQVFGSHFTKISNRNSVSSQIGGAAAGNSIGLGVGTSSIPTSAVDTTAAVDIVFTAQKADAADTITLESYTVLLMYGP